MAQLDASIYGNVQQPQPIDLLGMAAKGAAIQNQLNENRKFQMQVGAQRAVADLIPKYTDPSGNVNVPGIALELAKSPYAMFASSIFAGWMEAQKMGYDAQKAHVDAYTAQLDQDIKKNQIMAGMFSDLANDPFVDGTKLRQRATTFGLYPGFFTADQLQQGINALTGNDQFSGPALGQRLKSAANAAQMSVDWLKYAQGDILHYNAGGTERFIKTVPMAGTAQEAIGPAANLANTLTPEAARKVQTLHGPQGQDIDVLTGQLNVPNQAQSVPQPLTGGSLTAPAAGQSAPSGGQVQPLSTGPSASDLEFSKKVASNQADAYQQLQENAGAAGQSLQMINRAQEAASKLRTGGGANFYYDLSTLAQTLGASPELVNQLSGAARGDVDGRAAVQEFRKYMLGLVGAQIRQTFVGAGGVRIAAEYDNLVKAFPDIEMQPGAIKSILGFMAKTATLKQMELSAYTRHVINPKTKDMGPAEFQDWWLSALREKGIIKYNMEDGKYNAVSPTGVEIK